MAKSTRRYSQSLQDTYNQFHIVMY